MHANPARGSLEMRGHLRLSRDIPRMAERERFHVRVNARPSSKSPNPFMNAITASNGARRPTFASWRVPFCLLTIVAKPYRRRSQVSGYSYPVLISSAETVTCVPRTKPRPPLTSVGDGHRRTKPRRYQPSRIEEIGLPLEPHAPLLPASLPRRAIFLPKQTQRSTIHTHRVTSPFRFPRRSP
jgi:hypothetical protein